MNFPRFKFIRNFYVSNFKTNLKETGKQPRERKAQTGEPTIAAVTLINVIRQWETQQWGQQMLTVSFKTSTLESIPRYAISEPISPLAGLTARARYDPSPVLRTALCSLPSLPPLVSFPCRYITAATSSYPLESRSPFFPALCTRNHPPLWCLCFFPCISAAEIERETNEGRVGMRYGTEENAGERRACGTGRGCWKIVTFRLISSNVPPLRRSLASSLSLLYMTCSYDHHPAVPSPRHLAHASLRSSSRVPVHPRSHSRSFTLLQLPSLSSSYLPLLVIQLVGCVIAYVNACVQYRTLIIPCTLSLLMISLASQIVRKMV